MRTNSQNTCIKVKFASPPPLRQTSADSAVRVQSLSRCCPDFPKNPVRCLSDFRILSGFLKKLFVVCLSGRTRTRQSCPNFHCPCPPTFVLRESVSLSFLRLTFGEELGQQTSLYVLGDYSHPFLLVELYSNYVMV